MKRFRQPAAAPPLIDERAVQPAAAVRRQRDFYDPINGVTVERNRWVLLSFMLLVALILALCALAGLTPLKEVEPYVLEVDPASGRAVQSSRLRHFTPARAEIAFAAAAFTEKLMSIQRHLLEINLQEAQAKTCGVAKAQINQYVRQSAPKARLIKDPNLVRTVHFPSDPVFPPQAENTVIVRVRTVTDTVEDGQAQRAEAFWVMTLNYVLRKSGERITFEKFRRNPLGICWTSFFIVKENAV